METKLELRQLHDDLSLVQKQLKELFDKEQKVEVNLSSVEVSNFPIPLPIDFPEVQLTEVVNVVETSVNNLDELIAYVENLRQTVEDVMSNRDVSVLNPVNEVAVNNLGTVQSLLKAIANKDTSITFPKAPREAIPVVLTDKDRKTLYNAVFQGGGGGSNVPLVDGSVPVLNPDGTNIGAGGKLVTEEFDYISASYPNATTETYTYKTGGAGGTTVATVTVVYTTSAKDIISSVAKT